MTVAETRSEKARTPSDKTRQARTGFGRLVDLDQVSELMHAYARSTGVAMGFHDLDGAILITSNWQPICSEFHRRCPAALEVCVGNDVEQCGGNGTGLRTCPHGLIDAAAPVVVDGRRIATVIIGQFLLEPPDIDQFRDRARRFGFDEAVYLEALGKVPVLSAERANATLEYLVGWAQLLGNMGLDAQRRDALEKRNRRALSDLRASQRRYRLLFEESPVAMWEEDHSAVKRYLQELAAGGVTDFAAHLRDNPDVHAECVRLSRILSANRAAVELFKGRDRDELIAHVNELVVETDIRLFWAAMMRGEQSATYEEVYLTMAGDKVGIEETCTIAPGHETLADLVCFSDVDITARKQTEADLRAAEERFRTLVESLQEAVVAMDLDGVVTYASPRVLEVTGYESSDLIGRQAADFILPEDRPPAAALTPRVRSGPVNVPVLRAQAADGSIRHLRVFTQPIFENGRLAGLVATVRDDSELVKSEQRRKKLERRRRDLVRQLSATLDAAGTALARTVEMRDPYTAGHQERVARLALAIAVRLNVPPAKRLPLRVAAEIHDLGKMAVPAEILSKPGTLNEIEFGLLRQHPETGFQVLQGLNLPRLTARIIREHHERLDGSGYPRGLKGDAISLGARILAVADVVEAMSAHRPYRPSLGIDAALEEISQQRGVLYDPASVDACLALFREDGFSFAAQDLPPDED